MRIQLTDTLREKLGKAYSPGASSNASHSSAALAHSNRFSIMPQPCSHNSASSPGVQASKTRPMLVRRRGSGLLIGQTSR